MTDKEKKARLKELEALSPAELAELTVEAETKLDAALAEKAEIEVKLKTKAEESEKEKDDFNKINKTLSDNLKAEQTARVQAESERDEALELNEELNAELEKVRNQKAKDPNAPAEITHEGQTYLVAIPRIKHGGKIITVTELEQSPELVEELLEIGSGMLVLKTEEEN